MGKYDINIDIVEYKDIKNIQSAVYVFEKDDIRKIGMVNRYNGTLDDRRKEQEKVQWVLPNSIKVELVIPIDDPHMLEHILHNDPSISEHRCHQRRELFNIDSMNLMDEIINHCIGRTDKVYLLTNTKMYNDYCNKHKSTKYIDISSDNIIKYRHKNGFEIKHNETRDLWSVCDNDIYNDWYTFNQFAVVKGCVLRNLNYKYTAIPREKFISDLWKLDQ